MKKRSIKHLADIKWYGPRMELARGIAILLVTLGHSEPIKTALPAVKHLIYSFHMPLFFFMAGFFSGKFRSEGLKNYVMPRLLRLMIPYFVITASFTILKWLVPSLVNRPVEPAHFLKDLLFYPLSNPALFLWFLYLIILMKLLTALCRFVPVGLMFILSIVPAIFLDVQYDFAGLSRLAEYTVLFMGGLWLADHRQKLFRVLTGNSVSFLLLILFAALYTLSIYVAPSLKALSVIVALSGTFMVLSFCFTWYEVIRCRLFEFSGRYSLEIYLLQYYFIFPVYYLMIKKGVEPVWIIPFTFLAGIIGPALIIKYILPKYRLAAVMLGSRR